MISESVTDIAQMCAQKMIDILPISVSSIERIQQLPIIHNDPFDCIIIATALEEKMTLVTDDEMIKKYNVDLVYGTCRIGQSTQHITKLKLHERISMNYKIDLL